MERGKRTPRKRLRKAVAAALGAAALSLLAVPSAGAVNASYTFGTGAEGWQVSQTNQGDFTPVIFNPAGFIAGQDIGPETGCPAAPCQLLFFVSPGTPTTLAANYGGSWSFDLASSAPPGFLGVAYIDSVGSNSPELRRAFTAPTSGFGRVNFNLTEAGWNYCTITPAVCTPATQAQFQSVLATANFTDILADTVDGTGETYSLDNVTISEKPKPKKKCKKKGKKSAGAAKKKKKKKCKKKGKKRSAPAALAAGLNR